MVHHRWEAPFVTTFHIKDNLLIYTKTICKSSYKMQKKKMFLSFVLSIFFQTRKTSHATQLFYLSIYLFVIQLTSQKVIYCACRKKKCHFFLPFLSLSFFFQSRKKNTLHFYKKANMNLFKIGG